MHYVRSLLPMKKLCGDCGAEEGSVHILGCDLEECPVCLGQLIGCECPKRIFGDSHSHEVLDKLWCRYLEGLGRKPFLNQIPSKSWEGEGASPSQELMTLLLASLQQTPRILPNPAIQEYPPVEVGILGSFKVRFYATRAGRDTSTGEPVTMRERLVPIFTAAKSLPERFTCDRLDPPGQLDSPSSLIRSLDCAIDFLHRTKERQFELQEVGILKVAPLVSHKSINIEPRYFISITFFEDFMDTFEEIGLLERRLPTT